MATYYSVCSVLFLLLKIYSIIDTSNCLSETDVQNDVSLGATRTVDLTSQIVKAKTEYQIENKGKTDISYFVHAISGNEAQNLSWMTASETGNTAKLRISKTAVKGAPAGFVFHKIELLSLLSPGAKIPITVEYSVTGYLIPHPKEIVQSENQ